MNRIFDVVQSLAGQKNVIVIPVPYLDFFKSDQQSHMLAAILNQLVYWSGIPSSLDDGWFYKDYEELASEIRGVTADQVRKAAKKIIQNYLPGVIESTTRKVNGVPKKHWRLNGSALIARIFPQALVPTELSNGNGQEAESEGQRGELDSAVLPNGNGDAPAPAPHDDRLDSAELPNGNGQVAEWKRLSSRMEMAVLPDGNGQEAESYLYADHYTDRNIQIKKTVGQSPAATDPQPVDSLKIDYLEVLEAYHATLPEMPRVLDMTQDRRTKLYALWEKYDLSQGRWAAYLRYIAKNCRWMLEDRPDPVFGKTWRRKSFDYLITEKCYLSVKELRANDLPKVLKIDTAARQDAFERLVSHPGKPQNAVEEAAMSMARGLGRMNETFAFIEWKGIWATALEQVSENELRGLLP
ncbi:hypothetical protein HL273_08875 [Yersinia enterocolitica]|uniref:hypothetical protein n=1 Tax=Yersinia enterocolitica TaxID=630 RepID=UPI001C203527|nr:hypothetical protein [Yersinia enterocolitica]MBX9485810.1 hypothetical protein [Yersinia enterocolitica]NQS96729.1 hypothetical protein [Yersinia enterocolitica]NQT43406.1 hypothetical protein [Yersinia enterocolitica]NQT98794.1 hypothetical protein [Yersinia enterocolitica]HDM8448660.1 hypothetical protein [Yersinia enterocolitica]